MYATRQTGDDRQELEIHPDVFDAGLRSGAIKRRIDGYYWGRDRVVVPFYSAQPSWRRWLKRLTG